jgi:hypothetical protein
MTDPDHSPESYRLLFTLLGIGLLFLVLVFILASALVIPVWAVVSLMALWAVATFLALSGRGRMPWLPLAAGAVLAVVWIVVLTVGSAVLDWGP